MSFLKLQTPQDLANFFDIELKHLMYLTYVMPSNIKYKNFKIITKKKERLISSPFFRLKKIQYRLKEEFEKIYKPRKSVYGFIRNKSIKENAINHLNKRYVFNLDLQNFFGSITSIRIKYLLINHPFNFPSIVAEIISKLICYQGVLPQGSPCSPIVSNMIAHRMDGELGYLAKKNNATYTRYVDDITFSFTKRFKALPKDIINFKNGDLNVGNKLDQIIISNGFIINQRKVRLGKKSNRMEVTGIIVNEKLNVPRKYIKKIRALLYLVEKYGVDEADKIFATFKRTRASKFPPKIQKTLYGMLNYLGYIIGIDNIIFYKLGNRYNELFPSQKIFIIKPKELQVIDALWIVMLPSMEEGTAFSIKGGLVVTAAHVILSERNQRPYQDIEIYKVHDQNNLYKLKVLEFDKDSDIAICKIENDFIDDSSYELASNSNDSELKLLGFPNFQSTQVYPHCVDCKLSFRTKIFNKDFFSINTQIIGGNSGGPVINAKKEVIGLASKGYYGQGDIEDNQNGSIHVTIMGHNLCSDVSNIHRLITIYQYRSQNIKFSPLSKKICFLKKYGIARKLYNL